MNWLLDNGGQIALALAVIFLSVTVIVQVLT